MKKRVEVGITHLVPPPGLLDKSIALVTGGTGGIGFAIASDLVLAGCRVIVASTNREKFQRLFGELPEGTVAWLRLDMHSPQPQGTWDGFVDEARLAFGATPNLWVLAAGVHSSKRGLTFLNAIGEDYDSVVSVDLEATCSIALAAARTMIGHEVEGRIVIVSSSTGGEPAWSPYRVAKWGCNSFVGDVAPRLARYGIGIWSVCPGPCATPLLGYGEGQPIGTRDMQQGRYVMPGEVSPYVVSLLAADGLPGTGQSLYVSGGRGTYDIR